MIIGRNFLLGNDSAGIFAGEVDRSNSKPISAIQLAAINLYNCDLNVFPICSSKMVSDLSLLFPERYNPSEKLPYILNPLFFSRMHLCNSSCVERESRTGISCRGNRNGIGFIELFDDSNLGVILGRTSGNLVCLDCDATQAFDTALKEFRSRGLDFWAYYTSRGGNLLFRLEEGESANINVCTIPDSQIWGNRHFCVLPPSIHPSGMIYTWIDGVDPTKQLSVNQPPPILSIQQLDWLGIRLKNNIVATEKNLYGLPEWTGHLSENNRRILASEIEEGERNTMLTKVIYDVADCIDRGLVTYSDAEKLLFFTASRCLPPYPRNKIIQMLRSAQKKVGLRPSKEYYNKNFSSPIEALLQPASQFLANHDWRTHGRTAQSDRVVFGACIFRAKSDGSLNFRASSREIADLANLQQHTTALAALKRLQEKGILILVQKDDSQANRYTFGDVVSIPQHTTNNQLKNSGVLGNDQERIEYSPMLPAEQDVFLRLGKVSWIVWKHLIKFPEPGPCVISKKINMNQSSVSKALAKLKQVGLVSYSNAEGMYLGECLTDEELKILASTLDVFGKSDRRRERFTRDREIEVNRKIALKRNNLLRSLSVLNNGVKEEA